LERGRPWLPVDAGWGLRVMSGVAGGVAVAVPGGAVGCVADAVPRRGAPDW